MFPSISPHPSPPPLEVFDAWNAEKKNIQHKINQEKPLTEEEKRKKRVYINEREVWYISLGQNLGSESHGKKYFRRPVLVIKKVGSMFFVVPMTTKGKENIFHHEVQSVTYNLNEYSNIPEISRVQLSQARIVDKARFLERIATLSEDDFFSIKRSSQNCFLEPLVLISLISQGIPKDICKNSIANNSQKSKLFPLLTIYSSLFYVSPKHLRTHTKCFYHQQNST
jgi:mRNA-degrading endonuclease toxin of MazEF toxin-antitoxin module